MKKVVGVGVSLVATTVVVAVPPVVAQLTGHPAVAGALILPTIAALLPALLADVRTSVAAAVLVSAGTGAAAAVSGDVALSGLVMALVALASGLGTRWGRSKNLMLVPITVGFVICMPPSVDGQAPIPAVVLLGVSLAAALWGTAAGWFLGRKSPRPQHTQESWSRTWAFAVVLAILTGIAASISVGIDWGHAGAWFIMTVVLVFQPYLSDAFTRTWQRAAGTVVGVVGGFLIYLVLPWNTVQVIVGAVLMIAAILVIANPKYPYWFFTSLITPAIVLLAGSSGNFVATDGARLVATFAGVALAFGAELLLTPLYRASATKHGHTRF